MAGRPPAFALRLAPKPGDHPDDIHGGRREEVLEVRACQAKIPTPPEIEASPFPPLPTVGAKRRPNHIDLMLSLGGDQEVRVDIPAVEQVYAWEHITIG